MKYTTNLVVLLLLLAIVPGCCWRKKAKSEADSECSTTTIQVPVGAEGDMIALQEPVEGFFDSADGVDFDALQELSAAQLPAAPVQKALWDDAPVAAQVKPIYFDFDDSKVRADQHVVVELDAKEIKSAVGAAVQQPLVVVEGHADHSAGSSVYNLALSEKRARSVVQEMNELGVDTRMLQVVGRGFDVPAVINGKPVTGDRNQQWANRRVELHFINS